MSTVSQVDLPLTLFHRGKVRDTYDWHGNLLMVATDRISAFDVVLPSCIPDKGRVLTQLSVFWFEFTQDIVPNHLIGMLVDPEDKGLPVDLAGRSLIVRRLPRLDFECVVRGYLAGGAWAEYKEAGTIAGERMPPGLQESDRLPTPLFTPAIKAANGHDQNVSFSVMSTLLDPQLAGRLRDVSLLVYDRAVDWALNQGIIIADTKFEFAYQGGELVLIDELLTPDSSRFWSLESWQASPHGPQPSLDKQYVRDWLLKSGWDLEPPAPELPPEVVQRTSALYREAYTRLTHRELA